MALTAPPVPAPAATRDQRHLHQALRSDPIVALLGYLVLTLILTYPLPFSLGSAIEPGDPLLNAWIFAWYGRAVPWQLDQLFNPPFYYPFQGVLLWSEHFLAPGILLAPIVQITGNAIVAYNLLILASFVLAGFATFLLVRDLTGNGPAAFIAGAMFAFSPFRFAHFGHVHVLALWALVFALFFLDRFLVRPTLPRLFGFGFFLLFQTLSSYNYVLFVAITIAIWTLVRLLLAPRLIRPNIVLGLASVALVVGAANLPIALRYVATSETLGFRRSVFEVTRLSATWDSYLTSPPTNWLYGIVPSRTTEGLWSEQSIFAGTLALLFAVIGLIAWIPRPGRSGPLIAYLISGLVALSLSFGLNVSASGPPFPGLYPWLYEHVSLFQGIRAVARAGGITLLTIAVFAGVGISVTLEAFGQIRSASGKPQAVLARVSAGLLLLGVLIEGWSPGAPTVQRPIAFGETPAYRWLKNAEPGAVVELPIRTYPDDAWGETVRMYYITQHWKPLLNGYSGFEPPPMADLSKRLLPFPTEDAITILAATNVRYLLVHRGEMRAAQQEAVTQAASRFPLTVRAEFEDDIIFEIAPRPPQDRTKLSLDVTVPPSLRADSDATIELFFVNDSGHVYAHRWYEPYQATLRWRRNGATMNESRHVLWAPLTTAAGEEIPVAIPLRVPSAPGDYVVDIDIHGELAPDGTRFQRPVRVTP